MCYQLNNDDGSLKNMNHTSSSNLLDWRFEEEGCITPDPSPYDAGGVWSGGSGYNIPRIQALLLSLERWWAGGNDGKGGFVIYSTLKVGGFSVDPTNWSRDDNLLFDTGSVPNWPGLQCCCPDFFPVSGSSSLEGKEGAKWIVKSMGYVSSPVRQSTPDYVMLGEYDNGTFEPDVENGIWAVDYGNN